ncbi:MAG: DUF997 family protein [Verrucomicrobiae bacterium]|nr:DUF997 family protein [Verrucomicrobiae bacterium]
MTSITSDSKPDEEPSVGESLGDSFRQARREMWVMVAAWIVFFTWVTVACARSAYVIPEGGMSEIPTILGMPSWVVLGIGLPWVVANLFIAWFALGFMKDTPLPDNAEPEASTEA